MNDEAPLPIQRALSTAKALMDAQPTPYAITISTLDDREYAELHEDHIPPDNYEAYLAGLLNAHLSRLTEWAGNPEDALAILKIALQLTLSQTDADQTLTLFTRTEEK